MKLSIVLPNYNHAKFLPRSLGALLSQTVAPHEIIVVDDGSTDSSRQLLAEYKKSFPQLIVIFHEKNSGVYAALKTGCHAATGDYVAFPAADDVVRESWVYHADRMLRKYPQAGIFTGICKWNDPSGLTWHSGGRMPNRDVFLSPSEVVKLCQAGAMCVAGQHAFHRRSDLIQIFATVPPIAPMEDLLFGSVCMFRGGVCFVPEVLSEFNLSATSWYNQAPANQKRKAARVILETILRPEFNDVAAPILASGCLSDAGFGIYQELGQKTYALNWAMLTRGVLRLAEYLGRKILPRAIARKVIRRYYTHPVAEVREVLRHVRLEDSFSRPHRI